METLEYLIINENGTINIMEHNGEGAEHDNISICILKTCEISIIHHLTKISEG